MLIFQHYSVSNKYIFSLISVLGKLGEEFNYFDLQQQDITLFNKYYQYIDRFIWRDTMRCILPVRLWVQLPPEAWCVGYIYMGSSLSATIVCNIRTIHHAENLSKYVLYNWYVATSCLFNDLMSPFKSSLLHRIKASDYPLDIFKLFCVRNGNYCPCFVNKIFATDWICSNMKSTFIPPSGLV